MIINFISMLHILLQCDGTLNTNGSIYCDATQCPTLHIVILVLGAAWPFSVSEGGRERERERERERGYYLHQRYMKTIVGRVKVAG